MTRAGKIASFLIPTICIVSVLAYGTVHQPIISLFYLTITVLVMLWAGDSFAAGELRFSKSLLPLPLFLLGVYGLIQTIPFGSAVDATGLTEIPRTISLEPFATRSISLHIVILCLYYAVAAVYLDSARRLHRLVTVITIFGSIYAFYAILQSVLSPNKIYGLYGPQNAIPFGSFVNKHNFAALMEMVISVPLGMLFVGAVKRDKKLLYAIAVVLMITSLLLSGSRGGLVAMITAILVMVFVTTRSTGIKNLAIKGALSIALLISAIGGAIFVGGDTSLTRFADSAKTNDFTSSRTQIWAVTLKVITSGMPFGVGIGAYPTAYTKFDSASGTERVEQAHNDYLQVLADAGIIGLILGLGFLFVFFREATAAIRVANKYRRGVAVGAFAGCCAVLVHSIFDFVLHITAISVMFLLLLAMLVASRREFVDDIEDEDEPRKRRKRSASVTSIGREKESLHSETPAL